MCVDCDDSRRHTHGSRCLANDLHRSLQLIVPALNARLEREWFFDCGAESAALEICAFPREVRRDRHHDAIAEPHLEGARRDQPASGRRSNERRQLILGRECRDHFRGARRVFVHEHRNVAVMALSAKSFSEHRDRASGQAELDDEWQNLKLR